MRDYTPAEMLRTPLFWILYVMFVLVASSGLVVTAQVAPIAKDYKIANLPVNILFISSTVIIAAGIVDNILNGLARPTFGWVSDHIGRENTMFFAFMLEGAILLAALGLEVPVRLGNDADLGALAQHRRGAGIGLDHRGHCVVDRVLRLGERHGVDRSRVLQSECSFHRVAERSAECVIEVHHGHGVVARLLDESGAVLIGYRALRDAMRAG